MHFKARISETRQFKWYLNAGPNISYWLGGKGVINAGELVEDGVPPIKYTIEFGTRPDNSNPDILYIKDANRLQFGMNIEGVYYSSLRLGKKLCSTFVMRSDILELARPQARSS